MTKLERDKLVALLDDKYLAEHVERIVWALENPRISTREFLKGLREIAWSESTNDVCTPSSWWNILREEINFK